MYTLTIFQLETTTQIQNSTSTVHLEFAIYVLFSRSIFPCDAIMFDETKDYVKLWSKGHFSINQRRTQKEKYYMNQSYRAKHKIIKG